MNIQILLADDHKIVRDGLRSLLDKKAGMCVAGEARNGRDAVRLAGELHPHVIVLDIGMPDLNGIEATRQIKTLYPEIKILVLSMQSDRRFVAQMLGVGASGYLLKDCAFEELTGAITSVAQGQTYLSPSITSEVIRDYVRRINAGNDSESHFLTPREREVIQLLAEGKTTKEVANSLHISVKTVETHRMQIMGKLDVHSIAQLTKFAIREGLTRLEE